MPILLDGKVIAVIDLDCEVLAGYNEVDQKYLEQLGQLLASACDWDL